MAEHDYDLFVIGAGSGGVRAARMSAGFGARVAVCEDRYLGGTCVNVGCVPKKLFVYGAHFAHALEDAAAYGHRIRERSFDWPTLKRNKDAEIARLNGVYRRLLESAGCRIVEGRGRLLDPHTVEVGGVRHTAERILVATGSWPTKPDIPGAELAITSNEVFALEALPRRMVITGGGYIAVEFASVFAGLGVEIDLVHRGEMVLRGFDGDVRSHITEELRKQGVRLHLPRTVERIERHGAENVHLLDDGTELRADLSLCATGRRPLTAGLGLDEVGVELDPRGGILVNDAYQSSVPSIYAIGDVIDRVQLTPVALAEGMALAKTLFGGEPTEVDYGLVPTAVFTQPNIGTVGLTEEQAWSHAEHVVIYRSRFTPLVHTLSGRDEKTLMKLVVDGTTQKVLGCHMVGPDAGEIIQGLAVALTCGATKGDFDRTLGIHPTAAEEFVTMRTPVTAS